MLSLNIRLNPLLSSATHQSFGKAVKDLGCTPLKREVFLYEIKPYLLTQMPNEERLWSAVLAGEVLSTEIVEQGHFLFHVRCGMGRSYIDVRLSYQTDTWHVEAVTSVHERPFIRTPLFTWITLGASVLVAGIIGYAIAPQSQQSTASPSVAQWAAVHGYTLVKTTTIPNKAPDHATQNNQQSITFKLQPGMSVHDISVFLQQHHLIKDAVNFDETLKQTRVDRALRPGNYTFTMDMNESQLIQVLRNGPSSSNK